MSPNRQESTTKNNDLLIGNFVFFAALAGGAYLVSFAGATRDISRILYLAVDIPAFLAIAGIVGLASLAAFAVPATAWQGARIAISRAQPWHVALAVLVVLVLAVDPVYHGYALSMDEFMTRLQSQAFVAGRLAGQVPEAWQATGRALYHAFAQYDPETGLVATRYRPGMALIYAAFDLVGLGRFASAALTAGSVLLVASLARKLWPGSDEAPLAAALILATSQQALVMGLTAYAMPAHLFFNLLWLRLFLAGGTPGLVLAPFVGVWTAALHQVHAHAFFAAPFLLTLLRPFRPWLVLYYAAVYLLGHAAILGWDQWALGGLVLAGDQPVQAGVLAVLAERFHVPGAFEIGSILALLARFLAWQNLALVPLFAIAVRRGALSPPLRLMAASIAASLLPYLLLMPDQGHGWGYRYLHGLIGNFALIATAGWLAIAGMGAEDRARTRGAVALATVLTVLVMLPLRAWQVEGVVGPFARASALIERTDADVVVIDTPSLYYGQDLVRNDAFAANRPVVVNLRDIDPATAEDLCRRYAVVVYGAEELAGLGAIRQEPPWDPPPGRREMLEMLRDRVCSSRP